MKHIFKDCDIRGIYGQDFNEEDAYLIGRAIGSLLMGKSIVVCGDVRNSTPILKARLKEGILMSGGNIIDLGQYPTPVMYFAKYFLKAEGAVMVTASHNPAQYNGFKVMLGDMPITRAEIDSIWELIEKGSFKQGAGKEVSYEIEQNYIEYYKDLIKKGNKKVVIDAGNGGESLLAPKLFRELGYQVEELFCSFDGTFPNRDPNPAVYAHLSELQKKVVETGADFGVAFDGDGDRVVFADEQGNILPSESALCILMEEYFAEGGGSVVYDLKSSSAVKKTALKLGAVPIMERSGHAYIKRTFNQHRSRIAGEISGHFFFRELGYDDGLYAAVKMGEHLSLVSKPLSVLNKSVPSVVISADIRIPWPYGEQDTLLARVEAMGKEFEVSNLDGVRLDFGDGWILVRKSVTEELITIRIEGDDQERQTWIVHWLLDAVPELKSKIPL